MRPFKIKCVPEDFRVEELTSFECCGGDFVLYRLTKRNIGTLEAVATLQRAWRLPPNAVSLGGLKDRHAATVQHLSIHRGPDRRFRDDLIAVEPIGGADRPFQSSDISGNRFCIVLRSVDPGLIERVDDELKHLRDALLPNYFDDQRFGSRTTNGEFVAVPWCLGDHERTIQLAIAEPCPNDRPADLQRKAEIRRFWGDWRRLAGMLRQSPEGRVFGWLTNRPGDFRGAVAMLPADLRSLYINAFQSWLWNRLLAATLIEESGQPAESATTIADDSVPLPRLQSAGMLPLPAARQPIENPAIECRLAEILSPLGMNYRQLRVKYPRDSFFSKGERATAFRVNELTWSAGDDEMFAGRLKVGLQFTLDRGSYATVVVKRLEIAAAAAQ